MSTTPSPSELPYTVVGESNGPVRDGHTGVSGLVLNRGGRPIRLETMQPFAECGVDELVVVLGPHPHYEIEQLASRLPRTRFVLLSRDVTVGERINIGIHEARYPLVFTVWSDMEPPTFTRRLAERCAALDAVCSVPLIKSERNETVPSQIAPALYRSLFRPILTQPGAEGSPSLYVYADTGVFDRARFDRLGGYDPQIQNPYWQRLDFGFRAYLWGDRILALPSLRVQASRPLPPDDTTADASYARFHLKNLAIRFVRDQGRLPLRQLVPFLLRSGLGITGGVRQFVDVRRWVGRNRYRFAQDARRVTELWEVDA